MADEKQIDDLKLIGVRGRKVALTEVSLLVLTLLLTCSVAALIYLSVSGQHSCQQLQTRATEEKIDLTANIKVESGDGKMIEEKITYNQVSRVAYYNGDDGSFAAEDFGKGIRLFKNPEDGICYLLPVGGSNSSSSHDFENFIGKNKDAVVHPDTITSDYEILPGEIDDLSIIPEGARSKCENGYQWMVPKAANSGEENEIQHGREKRAICYRIRCVYFIYRGRLYLYCYRYPTNCTG